MNKKLFYTAPTSKLFEVRMEGLIAASPDGSWDKSIKEGSKWGSDDEDYGME